MVPKGLKDITLECRLLLGILVTRSNGDNQSWPGQKTLAEEIGCAERSIRRYLKELEAKGYIEVKQVGKRRTNRYKVTGQFVPSSDGVTGQPCPISDRTAVSGPIVKEQIFKRTVIPPYPHEWGDGDKNIKRANGTNQRATGENSRATGNNPRERNRPRRPFIEGDQAMQMPDGTWRVKNYLGIWLDYSGDIKKNLVWK